MPNDVIAARYALALLRAIDDPAAVDAVNEELQALCAVVESTPDLGAFLEGPTVGKIAKHELLEKTFREKVHHRTLEFLHLLIDKQRIDHLVQISRELMRLVEERRNQIRVRVDTAVQLPPEQKDRLKKALDLSMGRNCILETKIDPKIVGGVVCSLADQVLDGSLRAALDEMRKQLLAASL